MKDYFVLLTQPDGLVCRIRADHITRIGDTSIIEQQGLDRRTVVDANGRTYYVREEPNAVATMVNACLSATATS